MSFIETIEFVKDTWKNKIPSTMDIYNRVALLYACWRALLDIRVNIPDKFRAVKGMKNIGFYDKDIGFYGNNFISVDFVMKDLKDSGGMPISNDTFGFFYAKYPYFEKEFFDWFMEEFG